MNENRLAEAKANYSIYLSDGLLKKVSFDEAIFKKLEENAVESLVVAQELFTNKTSFLWVVVSSYYSMFYIASAFLYKKGFKPQHRIVHKVVADTLLVLAKDVLEDYFFENYVEEKDRALSVAEQLLDSFEYERAKRSSFQYEMTLELKEAKANTSLERAKEFVAKFRDLLRDS